MKQLWKPVLALAQPSPPQPGSAWVQRGPHRGVSGQAAWSPWALARGAGVREGPPQKPSTRGHTHTAITVEAVLGFSRGRPPSIFRAATEQTTCCGFRQVGGRKVSSLFSVKVPWALGEFLHLRSSRLSQRGEIVHLLDACLLFLKFHLAS